MRFQAQFLLCAVIALSACTDNRPDVILETTKGSITIEVYKDKAPLSTADFLYYVDEGLYNNEGFYRVVTPATDPLDMGMSLIQGGRIDLKTVTPTIDHETTEQTGLSHRSGAVSIARSEPGSGSAAFFFISAGENTFLDYGGARNPDGQGYAVLGYVTDGMDVVRAIQSGPTQAETPLPGTENQFLETPVTITKAYRK